MKLRVKYLIVALTSLTLLCGGSSFVIPEKGARFPYALAGLTERQAAAHLLYRFTYGPTPGQIETVVKRGLEKWFQDQLEARLPEDTLNRMLVPYSALSLSPAEIALKFPRRGDLVKMAAKDGAIDEDSAKTGGDQVKRKLAAYMEKNGLKLDKELVNQLTYQKIVRAVYANNQMQEVMADFWFNHFNVSFTKAPCSIFIPGFEREVIRPNALGNFETLLIATAKSPAMLIYLDNFQSTGPNLRKAEKNGKGPKGAKGLNENYAREVMELHTLGVDGGYTQQDVTEAARVLTGWTIFPQNINNAIRKTFERLGDSRMEDKGFVHEGDFLFVPERHETGEKEVLGKKFKGGYQEGMQLLKTLAHHPSTAKFIARKIAVRFVNDDPPAAVIDNMAKAFSESGGDIKKVLMAMVSAPEFWGQTALREKIKSPFELTVSALRSLHATVAEPQFLVQWISQMGQKLYSYPAPTGFPDRGPYWINTGALFNRMNFGLALAAGRIKGVTVDLIALNDNHEPESAEAALLAYTKRLLPERTTETTVQRLTPLLNEENLQSKLRKVAGDSIAVETLDKAVENEDPMADSQMVRPAPQPVGTRMPEAGQPRLSQVVGIIIGSPEFQRR